MTVTELVWKPRGRDFYSAADGRFDLFRSADRDGGWVCIDWDAGVKCRRAVRFECEAWCRDRLNGGAK